MTLEDSWKYDFRTQAIECLLDRLEEYAAILNIPSSSYTRVRHAAEASHQRNLFETQQKVFCVVGKTCSGKSTFGERASSKHGLTWVEASSVLRTFHSEYEDPAKSGYHFAKETLDDKGADAVARRTLDMYGDAMDEGLVITGFRTIEELETIHNRVPELQVILIDASERRRFERQLARSGRSVAGGIKDFRKQDQEQWTFGLLRIAEQFADFKVTNDRTLEEYWQQIDSIFAPDQPSMPGVTRSGITRSALDGNQIYHCLRILNQAGTPLTCGQIEETSVAEGKRIRQNNANKVLKMVPELAKRLEMTGSLLRYHITDAGRAYLRYCRARVQPTLLEENSI